MPLKIGRRKPVVRLGIIVGKHFKEVRENLINNLHLLRVLFPVKVLTKIIYFREIEVGSVMVLLLHNGYEVREVRMVSETSKVFTTLRVPENREAHQLLTTVRRTDGKIREKVPVKLPTVVVFHLTTMVLKNCKKQVGLVSHRHTKAAVAVFRAVYSQT